MEFFDKEENWTRKEIRHGRGWTVEELRLKSNADLWKLWLVLYKERNMLLTMEAECERQAQLFASPERRFKVQDSMDRLQKVVAERNRAFNLLERGVSGEPPSDTRFSGLGLRYQKPYEEHYMPYWLNQRFWMSRRVRDPFRTARTTKHFLLRYWAMLRQQKRDVRRRRRRHINVLRDLYPASPVWKQIQHESDPMLSDIYHTRMSD